MTTVIASLFVLVALPVLMSAQQVDCNDPQAFNCELAATGVSECNYGSFIVGEGVDYLPGTSFLDDLVYETGNLGTGIPDTLLTVFDAGEVEGFFGVIRRNSPGSFPSWSPESGYAVPAGFSPTSTSNPVLSGLSTWNVIGYIDLGSLTFGDLNVELLFDLNPAEGTPVSSYSSLSISAGLGADAAFVSSFASNENLGTSSIELIVGDQPYLPFDPETEGEYGVGVRITNACGTVLLERTESIQVVAGISGCPFEGACNYVSGVTLPTACDYLSCLSLGCTDPVACNYDPTATYENGSCDYSCYPTGCTNPAACNFDAEAVLEDGSCEYSSCAGCVDENAANFDPTATIDNGSCEFPGCLFPNACNFDPMANVSDGSCEYTSCVGCLDAGACNYDPEAQIQDNSSCTYPLAGLDCDGNCLNDADGDGVCDENEIDGCTDPLADNFNPAATDEDGSCTFSIGGCLNPLACNYNMEATQDDGSCEFMSCVGCTDMEACNFDPEAVYADASACDYADAGYDCEGNCLSDLDFDGICEEFEVLGCTDEMALNFDSEATDLDNSCEYAPTCNDADACNPEDHEAFCIQVEAYATHDGLVGNADLTGMTTYRIYALCEDSTDVVSSVAGDDEFPSYLHSTGEVFQSDFGAAFAQDINPALFGALPELAYDSWVTIGLDGPAGTGESGVMSVEGIAPWISNFEETGTLAIQDSVGGLWFVLNNPSNAVAGSDLRVLLAQITTNGSLTGSLLIQFFQQGDGPNAAIKKFININEACMLPSTEGCEYAAEGYNCLGECLNDADGDGVCDEFEVVGCLDETACNFDPGATEDGLDCTYPEGNFDCEGNCLNDADGDGVCDSEEVFGCDQQNACNFDVAATEDDGSCVFAQAGLDCNGNCLNDVDQDGVCDGDEVFGCVDSTACNFEPTATENDGSCVFAAAFYDCNGNCLNDSDEDGVCDELEIAGCMDATACNFNEAATDEDGSCTYAADLYDCDGNCLNDSDADGVCDELEVPGCTDATACNFNDAATDEDGSCTFAADLYDCEGNCLNDSDADGICDELEVAGCTDATACNFNEVATDEDGSCIYAADFYDCDGNCLSDIDSDGVCDELELAGCTDETALNYDPNATDDDGSCEADPCNPDVTPPYFTFVPADSTITCDAPMPTGMAMAEDDCSDVIVTFIDGPIEYVFECPPYNYFCTRTFTAIDAAGNSADTTQYITVVDTIAPYFIYTPEDTIYVDEALGQTIPLGEVAVEDACDLMADWSYEDVVLTSVNDTTTIERTFTASDQCGNESTWVQIIIVYEAILGCTDELACNFDPEATADNDSCLYPESGYDCDGNCLMDSDGDGVCDPFEITGCTASNACNYNPDATDDDGACDFCSCAEGVFGNYGLEIEVVAVHDSGDLAGKTTYRFYVTTESSDDFVSSVYGSDQDTLMLTTSTEWHQDPLGANYAQGVNPTLYDMFPDLAFDSWLTIGLEGPADLAAGEQEVTTLGPAAGGWIEDFAAGNSVQVDDEIGGAWFVLNGASNGVAGDDLKVLVAQLTTDGEISGRINAQIFGGGNGANDLRFSFDFAGAEWVNNGGLTNACGCTDETAYNYDDAADYDNGACAYCALNLADVSVEDISCFGSEDGSIMVTTSGASTDSVSFALVPDGQWGQDSVWTNLVAGNYDVIALDGNGCSDTASVEVIEPEELLLVVDEVVDQTEGLSDGAISITVTGGTLDYVFDWSGLSGAYASNEEDIDGLLAGEYDVVVLDANGCTASVEGIVIDVIVGVNEFGLDAFRIWPNPAAEMLTIEWSDLVSSQGATLEVFNAMGQRLAAQSISPGTQRSELNLSDWASGRYTIRVSSASTVATAPLLILH
ncbi:T9SS type A sorting domain-containing protein [bacterium]|nr:T9SS type A sorting domain-containing protein [bacterium]